MHSSQFWLAGCGASAPKLTPAQEAERWLSTLKVYEDNAVALKTRYHSAWAVDPNRLLALEIAGKLYNARDIESVVPMNDPRQLKVTKVGGKPEVYARSSLTWFVCTREKVCHGTSSEDKFLQMLPDDLLTGNASGVTDFRSSVPQDPRTAVIDDRRVYPDLHGSAGAFSIVGPEEVKVLEARKLALYKRYDDKAPARAAAAAKEDQEYHDKQAARIAALKTAKLGSQTLCISKAISGEQLPRNRNIACSGYGDSSVEELEKLGWNMVAMNVVTSSDYVTSVTYYSHHATFQKVR